MRLGVAGGSTPAFSSPARAVVFHRLRRVEPRCAETGGDRSREHRCGGGEPSAWRSFRRTAVPAARCAADVVARKAAAALRPARSRRALARGARSAVSRFLQRPLGFALQHRALDAGTRCDAGLFAVTPFPAVHEAGAPCFSLRIECEGKVIAYSGDTEWNDDLAAAAHGADLFICECSSWERPLKGHIDYRTFAPRLAALGTNA